ncbi:MAG: hypothetical protein K2N47_03690 [Clostridia bacterium]|nr:hypothetical protein [Clostridia bacterium]
MKIKKYLRFYYSAGGLENRLDDFILRYALKSGEGVNNCEACFDKIQKLILDKATLAGLWARIDEVLKKMTVRDKQSLKRYAGIRGVKRLPEEDQRELHRAVMKFTRRSGGLINATVSQYKTLCAYYCLLGRLDDD